jgi:hypothetical protein
LLCCVDVNCVIPLVNQPDEAEVYATSPMSYVIALDNGMYYFLMAKQPNVKHCGNENIQAITMVSFVNMMQDDVVYVLPPK